jgi:hypothetical protein
MQRYQRNYRPRSVRRRQDKSWRNIVLSILVVLVFGFFLISWGLPILIGSLSIFNKLKPIDKTEEVPDTALAPPVLNIPFDATNSASIVIIGYAQPNSKVQIIVNDDDKPEISTLGDGSFSTQNIDLSEGTNYIYGYTTDSNNHKSLPSKTIKLEYSSQKPNLEIVEPADNNQIKGGDKKVKVSGKTDSDNTLSINGMTVILNSDGSFSSDVPLNDGDNLITITATSSIGNSTTVSRKVNYAAS